MENTKNVLVTGGTGFIGSALVRRLVKDGHAVRALDNNSRGTPKRLTDVLSTIELIEGSVCNAAIVDEATSGIDTVFHLAAVNGTHFFYDKPDRVLEVGIKGTINTMDAAMKHGVKRYLFASSSEAYQTPTHLPTTEEERLIVPDVRNPRLSYGGSKIAGELLALHYLGKRGVDPIIFRPHNIYGPDMGEEHVVPVFIKRLKELSGRHSERPLPFPIEGDGTQTRAFSFIDDCVNAIMLIFEKGAPGEIYNVGDEEETTIADLARMIAKEKGIEIEIQPGDVPEGSALRRCPDISKIKALGYVRETSLEEGLQRTVEAEWKRLTTPET